MKTRVDVNTGFPVVPEGFFWRIRRHIDDPYHFASIQLRKRRKVFGSEIYGVRHVQVRVLTKETALNVATELANALEAYLETEQHAIKHGDYPPNRLD